jgi:hypothetical protein
MPELGKNSARTVKPARVKSAAKRVPTTPLAALIDIADTLYRAAAAACSDHRRYAQLVERAAPEHEQKSARAAAHASDDILDEAVDLYEVACLRESNHADDAWWHRANMVWNAAKEYLRHHAGSNRLIRGTSSHGRAELMELSIEYKLEASSLLRLRHTIEAYRQARPEAG